MRRVGESTTRKVDVRVIAATNGDLEARGRGWRAFGATSTTASTCSRSRCRRCGPRPRTSPTLAEHFPAAAPRQPSAVPGFTTGGAGVLAGVPVSRQRPRAGERGRTCAGPGRRRNAHRRRAPVRARARRGAGRGLAEHAQRGDRGAQAPDDPGALRECGSRPGRPSASASPARACSRCCAAARTERGAGFGAGGLRSRRRAARSQTNVSIATSSASSTRCRWARVATRLKTSRNVVCARPLSTRTRRLAFVTASTTSACSARSSGRRR